MPIRTVAHMIAQRLASQGVTRVYGLVGGHIQPIWDEVDRAGIAIVDVRHEAAAVYMAQAESELTGRLGVALVTAGPGLTNAVTAIANCHVSRSSVLVVSGRAPRPQDGMGAMQDLPQADIVRPVCRRVEKVSEARHVLPRMNRVIAAALGASGGRTGPAYIDFPVDLLPEQVRPADVSALAMSSTPTPLVAPASSTVREATELIRDSRRVVVIGGRPVRAAGADLRAFLDCTGAFYLDSGECRGVIREDNPAYVPAMRGRLMREADLVITAGRQLDFQLAYGSSAVFAAEARFLRIGTCFEETSQNRRGDVEILGSVGLALRALADAGARPSHPDRDWANEVREANHRRVAALTEKLGDDRTDESGRMHPYRLIGALNRRLTPDSVIVADGGDILSFSRVGTRAVDYLDCGALGCLGVGVPFTTAAALQRPDAPVIGVIGDGSIGFTAMEIDTAVRHRASALFVVANNEAWNIERYDQVERYNNPVGVDLPGCRYDELARSLGAYAERVTTIGDLEPALDRALSHTPALLDVLVTREAESPDYANGLAVVPPRQALVTWDDAEAARLAL